MKKVHLLILCVISFYVVSCDSDDPVSTPDDNNNVPFVRELTIPETGAESPETYDGMQLAWQDEFDGSAVNSENWTFETGNGNGGWGNNELQYYRQENTSIVE